MSGPSKTKLNRDELTFWILETIDNLRRRKARPDIENITHMIHRRYEIDPGSTKEELDKLAKAEEYVIKVDFKGSMSYRNTYRNCCNYKHCKTHILNQTEKVEKVYSAAKKLLSAEKSGRAVGLTEVIDFLASEGETGLQKYEVYIILEHSCDSKLLFKVKNGRYSVNSTSPEPVESSSKNVGSKSKRALAASSPAVAAPAPAEAASAKKKKKISAGDETKKPKSSATNQPESPKKIRPLGKRKRVKKTHGPDFEQEPLVKTVEQRCDYCLNPASYNRKGQREDLLVCKDCSAAAHPSCMGYSDELAERSRMSPWQCTDCKICSVCGDSGDADKLLFCDMCDKGYHMSCHVPPVFSEPTGKWVCGKCCADMDIDPNTVNSEMDTAVASSSTPINENKILKAENSQNGISPNLADEYETKIEMEEASSLQNERSPEVATPTAQTANLPEQSAKSGIPTTDPSTWQITDVVEYFKSEGFADQAHAFEEQEIDGKSLLLLKRSDVLTGLSLKLGPALKIYSLVQKLQLRSGTLN